MKRKVNFIFRLTAMAIMLILLVFNQRVDALLIGLLVLLATTRYD
jgi:hypothetical protein